MPDEELQPIAEQDTTTESTYRDPYGPDPDDIPDPMPADLQDSSTEGFEEVDGMEGDAPTS